MGLFWTYRPLYPVSRKVLHDIADQYHNWVRNRAQKWRFAIEPDPKGRRDELVAPRFPKAVPDQVVAIIKAREPTGILTAIGKEQNGHLEMKWRWVDQYNFYVNDRHWGPMFVRVCPYFPFSARVCLNQHDWLAQCLRQRAIRFRQSSNAFLSCSDPEALQQLADSLTPDDLIVLLPKMAGPFHTLLPPRGAPTRRSSAPFVFCPNRVL